MTPQSACDLLRAEHRQIETQIDRLLTTVKHPDGGTVLQVRDAFAEIQNLMTSHAHKEEQVLYPYLRARFGELLAKMDQQHEYIAEVIESMEELTGMVGQGLPERQFRELIRLSMELFNVIQHHIVDEEDQLFRLANLHLSALEQDNLAAKMGELEVEAGPLSAAMGQSSCEKGGRT